MAKINSAKQMLTDVSIYAGTADQRSPQIVSDGSGMYVVFENYDIVGGTYPYGSVDMYKSVDGGQVWNYWNSVSSTSYHLYSPQIVLVGSDVVVSYQRNGALRTYRFDPAVEKLNPDVPVPVVSTTEYVVDHKMVTDAQKYIGTSYLYMAILFKQADGKNKVLFTISKDTARTWQAFDSLGLSQSELNASSIGLDYSSSGLYIAYLGTNTNAGSIVLRKSVSYGSSWTSETILPMNAYGGMNKKIGPMVAATGQRIAVIYQYDYKGDATDWKTGSDFDVYADVSDDGGATWQERVVSWWTGVDEILPNVTSDYDGNFYVSFLQNGKTRISMAGSEFAFGYSDSSSTANVSMDDFPSIYGSTVSGTHTAYSTWTELSNGLDIYGAATVLKIPPLSPANLVASVVSSTQIKLSWSDNSTDETGFVIYYRQTGTGAVFAQQGVVGAGVTSSSVTGLSSSTGYDFYVRAFNANGLSLRTNIVSATTQSGGTTIPTITSFTPTSGPIGTTVTIAGTNFDPTAANNVVYFGAVMTPVISSSSTSLKVTVPVGATYQPITITVNGLTAYSNAPFIVTFVGGGAITSNSFSTKVDFTTGSYPFSVAIGDVDGDGKPDLVVTNAVSNSVSVFRNTGTSGTISFAAKVDFTTGLMPFGIAIVDADGDGKLDLVVANYNSNTISVFRNTSTSGTISFATKVDFTTGLNPSSVAIGDVDGDGKPDLVVANYGSNTVSVFRNTSAIGSVSFAAKVDFTTGLEPQSVAVGDVDGDGKPDLAVVDSSSTVSVFRNTSAIGSVSFAASVDFTTGLGPSGVTIGDIDGDGRPDLAVANYNSSTISVFRNTGTSGTISFAAKVDFTTGLNPSSVAIGDVDGDGKLDFAVANYNSSTISVFRNTGTNGSVSFADKIDFTTGTEPFIVAIGDVDGDGKPDFAVVNFGSSTVSVFRNTILVDNTPPTFTVSPYTTGTPVLVDANGLVSSSPQVSASASDAGSGISRMQVAYRNTSEQSWSYSQFVSATSISFSIPTNKFIYNTKPIGVNYRVGAWDNAGNVTWSPYNSIDVQLDPQATDKSFDMPAASQLSNKTTAYRMISVPYDLGPTNQQPNKLLSNFGSHTDNNVSYARWRFQRYVNGQYQDYDQFSQTNAVIPGAAFFFIVRDQGSQIVVQGASVVRSDVMYNTGISLQSGWNLVGNPFNIPYPIDSLVFYATASTVPQPIRQHAYYSGTGPIGGWDTTSASVSQIQPWSGIAAYVNSAGTLKFPSAGQRSGLPKTNRVSSVPPIEKETAGNWTVAVNAYRADIDMRCEGSSLGMAQGANEGDDPYDSYIPPIVGDKNVAVYFKNADGAMMRDIRPLNEDGDVWEMRVVTGDAGANVKLTLGDHLSLPNPAFEAYLIDIDQKMAHNLKEVQSLEINSGNGIRNFRVVVGKKSFVEGNNAGVVLTPSSMKLYANYPNPFNPETVIRYTVPDASASYTVTLKIFNVLGQEIATLVNGQKSAGYYEVKWNALQQSSGIYFYRLSITDGSKTFQDIKKMVLMK